jgi:hypothetical protein
MTFGITETIRKGVVKVLFIVNQKLSPLGMVRDRFGDGFLFNKLVSIQSRHSCEGRNP